MRPSFYVNDLRDAGFTQQEIGREAGVSQMAISQISRNEDKDARASTFVALKAMHARELRRARQRLKDSEATLSALQAKEQS